jgi:hypothetical protein
MEATPVRRGHSETLRRFPIVPLAPQPRAPGLNSRNRRAPRSHPDCSEMRQTAGVSARIPPKFYWLAERNHATVILLVKIQLLSAHPVCSSS